MTQTTLNFDATVPSDICARKHKGAKRSVEANERIEPYKVNVRERIRVMVSALEWHGATVHEIAAAMGKLPHQISGRLSELKADGTLFESGRTRGNADVLVANEKWKNGHD